MGSLIVVIAVAALAFIWIRGTRRNRARWLARLDLPGTWDREGQWGRLELTGELTSDQRDALLRIADRCPVHRTLHSELDIQTRLDPPD